MKIWNFIFCGAFVLAKSQYIMNNLRSPMSNGIYLAVRFHRDKLKFFTTEQIIILFSSYLSNITDPGSLSPVVVVREGVEVGMEVVAVEYTNFISAER